MAVEGHRRQRPLGAPKERAEFRSRLHSSLFASVQVRLHRGMALHENTLTVLGFIDPNAIWR